MKDFQRDAVFVVENANQPLIVFPKPYGLAGVYHILFHEGAWVGIGLKVTPESTSAHPNGKTRKPWHGLFDSTLEQGRVYRFCHDSGKPIDGGVTVLLDGRIQYPRVVQRIPRVFGLLFGHG
ncbi:MAG: hypothetical protein ACLR6W_01920 [Evtepia sp.]